MQSAQTIPASSDRLLPGSIPWTSVFANAPAAAFVATGFGLELVCAWQRGGHALWSGGWGTLQAVAFMVWFWLTASWVGYFLARIARGETNSRTQLTRFGGFVLVTAATLGYIASWSMFLQTGRFANFEVMRFALANTEILLDYFHTSDAIQFLWLALVLAALFVGIPMLGRALARDSCASPDPRTLRLRLGAWLALLLTMSLAQYRVNHDASMTRMVMRTDAFRNCLNPVLTHICSALDAWQVEPIPACLEPSELVPLTTPAVPNSSTVKKQRSVIVIAIESLRADVVHLRHQGREVMPNLNKLAREGLQFTRAYAESTHSDYADVCLMSSLYPLRSRYHHYYRADDPWPRTMLYDLLKPRGYETAIISSQNESWGGMDKFLRTPGLDWYYHPEVSAAPSSYSERDPGFNREVMAGTLGAGSFRDRYTTNVALKWIKTAGDKPFCLAMNFQSSHFPYRIPSDSPRPFIPYHLDTDVKFTSYPLEKAPTVRNAYYNALAESDRQIGRLVDKLKALDMLDDVILVVTGENGEAFHENGAIGHAGNPVEPVVHIAAVVWAPGLIEPRVEDYPFEHVDLAPTLCGLLGVEPSPNFQGIDVLAADRPAAEDRLTYVHVLSPIAQADAVIRGGQWKYLITLDRPQGALFDVTADPGETHDLAESEPARAAELRQLLLQWRQRQLAYYHYPQYYGRFYPPQPPRN